MVVKFPTAILSLDLVVCFSLLVSLGFFPREKLAEPTFHFLYLTYVITQISSAVLDVCF